MRFRVMALLPFVSMLSAAGYGQAVAKPAVPVVGQPITISSLQSNGPNCGFYFELTGQGLPVGNVGFYDQAGGGLNSYTFTGTTFPGTYYATADPGIELPA